MAGLPSPSPPVTPEVWIAVFLFRVLVSMREREPAAAVLSFLTHLLAAAARLAAEENSGSGEGGRGDAMVKADAGRARLAGASFWVPI